MVVDQVQKMMAAALSPLTRTKAPDIATEGKEQISRAAQDLVDWSMRSRERMTADLVRVPGSLRPRDQGRPSTTHLNDS